MTARTLPLHGATRTVAAIDHAIAFNPDRPMLPGTGSGKSRPLLLPAVEAMLGNAMLRAAVENLRGEHGRLAARYTRLATAAQAAVIESRVGRRNPITPLAEALAGLGQLPAPGTRLHALVPEAGAAWPRGAGR